MTSKSKDGLALCVVCGKPLLDNNDCFSMGSDGYRHKKCKPGSSAWKAKYGESEISKMLAPKKRSGGQSKPGSAASLKADPLRQAIKEFCGRVSYFTYMDTINKSDIKWSVEITVNNITLTHTKGDQPLNPGALYEKFRK